MAKALVAGIGRTSNIEHRTSNIEVSYDPFTYTRRATATLERSGVKLGGEELVRVVVRQDAFDKIAHKVKSMGDYQPEIIFEEARVVELDPRDTDLVRAENARPEPMLFSVRDGTDMPVIAAFRLLAAQLDARHPILLKDTLAPIPEAPQFLDTLLTAATHIGALLCDGIGDAVLIQGEEAPGQ